MSDNKMTMSRCLISGYFFVVIMLNILCVSNICEKESIFLIMKIYPNFNFISYLKNALSNSDSE